MSGPNHPLHEIEQPLVFSMTGAIPPPAPGINEQDPPQLEETAEGSLHGKAMRQPRGWTLCATKRRSRLLKQKCRAAAESIEKALRNLARVSQKENTLSDEAQCFLDNAPLLRTALREARQAIKKSKKLPLVERGVRDPEPRAYVAAAEFVQTSDCPFTEEQFSIYMRAAQQAQPFLIGELWALKPMMQLALLERLAVAAESLPEAQARPKRRLRQPREAEAELSALLASLQRISEAEWKEIFEELSEVERILRRDPACVYARMDFESREEYRKAVVELAAHSNRSETEVARVALLLAGEAQCKTGVAPRVLDKRSHAGYYLVDGGKERLKEAIGYHPPPHIRVREAILKRPHRFYFGGIALGLTGIMALLYALGGAHAPAWVFFALLFFPAAEAAISLINQLTAGLIQPRMICKIDFSTGVPASHTTMVAVPTLLINDGQVRKAVRDLEIRYLGNRDRNLHFALLTDSSDSSESRDEKEALAGLCAGLVEGLNRKYAACGTGGFFLFHREPVYNDRERRWMGWERKRGKLIDFNNLLQGKNDRFPTKVGDLSILPRANYVITLDADTQLPRGAAQKLIGALAHPLNCAIIDPASNTVTEGYAILQPRVEVGIEAATRSRLAAILSGPSGFDIYTRAVSDVYQDLFGEGNFVGKGIYELEAFQQVLDQRFPCNALLSHDLIEGLYARAGLVTDVEVVEDFPSHYRAYTRRKHRWLRGDWQILPWLFPRVPDYFGRKTANPLSLLSRWKIFDNLRRSVTEIALFVLLAWCFFADGRAASWGLTALLLVLVPACLPMFNAIVRAGRFRFRLEFWREFASEVASTLANVFLRLALLCHQLLVSLDAMIRSIVRMVFTRSKLLEWETASEAELAVGKKGALEIYLDLCPWISLALTVGLAAWRPGAILVAVPFLLLWGCSKPLSRWLNGRIRRSKSGVAAEDRAFLRHASLRTWRFFRQYSTAETNWLVPDIVQETPPAIAQRISPTNLGLLLNSSLAACDLGYLTVPEFACGIERVLTATDRCSRFRGHFLNWYDIRTLSPLEPIFVSTVDSGNLACCLWTLKNGCHETSRAPLFGPQLCDGIEDHLQMIEELLSESAEDGQLAEVKKLKGRLESLGRDTTAWVRALPEVEWEVSQLERMLSGPGHAEARWWARELAARLSSVSGLVRDFAPWLLPVYRRLCSELGIRPAANVEALTLENAPEVLAGLDRQLKTLLDAKSTGDHFRPKLFWLRALLAKTQRSSAALLETLGRLEAKADSLVAEMDFQFLYDTRRKLLSVGYDVEAQRLSGSHYGLLASEARCAAFVAIAKGEIPQESWFRLGRTHTFYKGQWVLKSWSGTMFEYLLPSLWMRSYPQTLLERSVRGAVRCQQRYGGSKRVPWGISEAAYNHTDQEGNYQYQAFGLSSLSANPKAAGDIVVSPYASFLALETDAPAALENLRHMKRLGWLGSCGFYEAADFNARRMSNGNLYELVRGWMAHHQGMSLLTASSLLAGFPMQRRFHAEAAVAAAERLLQEKLPYRALCDEERTRELPRFSRPDREGKLVLRLPYAPRTPAAVCVTSTAQGGVSAIFASSHARSEPL